MPRPTDCMPGSGSRGKVQEWRTVEDRGVGRIDETTRFGNEGRVVAHESGQAWANGPACALFSIVVSGGCSRSATGVLVVACCVCKREISLVGWWWKS